MTLPMLLYRAPVGLDVIKCGITRQLADDLARWWGGDATGSRAIWMHIDDGSHSTFLATAIQKGKQAAGVVSMPMRDHDAFNQAKGRAETGQITGERLGFWTSIEKCEAGTWARIFICLLEVLRQ